MKSYLSKRQSDSNKIITSLKSNPLVLRMLATMPFEEVVEDLAEQLGASENEIEEALATLTRENLSLASKKEAQEQELPEIESQEEFEKRVKSGDTFSPEQYKNFLISKGFSKEKADETWFKVENQLLGEALFRHDLDSYYFRVASKKEAQTNIFIPATSTDPEKTISIPSKPNTAGAAIPETAKEPSVPVNPDVTDEDKTKDLIKSIPTEKKSRQEALIDAIKGLKVSINLVAESINGIGLTDEGQGSVVGKVIEAITAQASDETAEVVKSLVSPLIGTK